MRKHFNTTGHVKPANAGMTSPPPVRHVSFTILGNLVSMKNSRRLVKNRRNGKLMSIKSGVAEAWMAQGGFQIPSDMKIGLGGPETPLRAIVSVFYQSYRSDLDCALLYDLLQEAGVVSNDRYIREKYEYAHVDTKNPRVEVEIFEI